MLPTILTRAGLRAGVDELAATTSIPVEMDIGVGRLPPVVEVTAYFVVAEALTNVVKHARAERAEVRAFLKDETLYLEVRDNGVGGANPRGQGLVGLSDRVTALDGWLSIESPAQGGTILAATLPLNSKQPAGKGRLAEAVADPAPEKQRCTRQIAAFRQLAVILTRFPSHCHASLSYHEVLWALSPAVISKVEPDAMRPASVMRKTTMGATSSGAIQGTPSGVLVARISLAACSSVAVPVGSLPTSSSTWA
jgi:hypothetical protein